MNAFGSIEAEFEHYLHVALDKAKSIGHHATADLEKIVAKVHGNAAALEHEATADASQVAHDASAAMGPVLAEAEKDAANLGTQAVADATKAVTNPAPPAA